MSLKDIEVTHSMAYLLPQVGQTYMALREVGSPQPDIMSLFSISVSLEWGYI